MNYSLNQVTTVADCDALLNNANLERKDLNLRKLQQEKQYLSVSTGTTGIDAELMGLTAEIAAMETTIQNLPEGPIKVDWQRKLIIKNGKKTSMEIRRDKYGVIALVEKEFAIASIDKELEEMDAYVEALNQRKREL